MPLDYTDLDESVEEHLLSDPDDFCEWLLETGWWQQMQDVCTYIHPEFMEQFHAWLGRKFDALPEAERTREDWRVVDLPTLYRALHGFTHWIGAHKRMDSASLRSVGAPSPHD